MEIVKEVGYSVLFAYLRTISFKIQCSIKLHLLFTVFLCAGDESIS